MLSNSMSYLVSQHDGEGCLVLSDREQSLIHYDLASRHAESIDLLVLYEVKLPAVVFRVGTHAVVVEIGHNGRGQVLPYALDHSGVGGIG